MRRVQVGLLAAMFVVVGCSSTPETAPTGASPIITSSSSPAPTSTSTSTSSTTTTTSPTPTSETSTPESLASSVAPSESHPWPDGLSEADQIRAQLSIDALIGYWKVVDDSSIAPEAKDWSADIYQYATGTVAADTISFLESMVADGTHQVGTTVVSDVTVSSITATDVIVSACVNPDIQILDPNGTVTFELHGGTKQRARLVDRDLQMLVTEMLDLGTGIPC